MSQRFGDVVVLIPGISGSVLRRDGKDIWAPSPGAAMRALFSLGGSIKHLRLDGDDHRVDDLGDGISATRLVPDLHVLPGLGWKIDGYTEIKRRLIADLGCVEGANFFELPYDWRRDNRVAARLLARSAHDWLARWREDSGNSSAQLVIIGHSMGGIVARLYLELFEGWRQTKTLITFGTPYLGSINALDFMVNGFRKGWGPFTVDLTAMLRSFTSSYQLLPSYRCLAGEGGKWLYLDDDSVDWSRTAMDTTRLKSALTLQRELRAAVDARAGDAVGGYTIRPVIGRAQRTGWAAKLIDGCLEPSWIRDLDEEGGDGTVPTVSAIPHELRAGWVNAAFAAQQHASLQNDKAMLDHVVGVLLNLSISPVDLFPAPGEPITLEVDDVVVGEPLVIRARPTSPDARLVVTVTKVPDGASHQNALVSSPDGWHRAELTGISAGDYRVTVSGARQHSVTGVVGIVDPAWLDDGTSSDQTRG